MFPASPSASATPARRGRRARAAAAQAQAQAPPVWSGVVGGRYRPLSEAQARRVHKTALDLLEKVGLASPTDSLVQTVTQAGGALGDDGRLRFPRALVEDVIAGARRDVVVHGQRGGLELDLSGARVHVGSGGASPSIVDLDSGAYRDATLRDLYDAARLADALDNIHFFNRSLVARDVAAPRAFDLNTAYAVMAGTAKPIGTSFSAAAHVADAVAMFDLGAGGDGDGDAFRRAPFCVLLCCHVVPPLRFAEESCAVLERGVRLGMPVMLIAAGQAGATSPAALAGSVAQSVAETLAGAVFAYLLDPAAQIIFAPKPLVADLRTGAMSGGGGEQAALMAAAAQMGRFYGFPTSVIAGITDAKIPDAQHGYEKSGAVTLAAHAGANMITQACGMEASLLGCSFESYVIDNDMLGVILRTVRGIEVSDDTLSFETIREVVEGEGHFLGHAQTMQSMTRDYLYPQVADRATPQDWAERGGRDIRRRARDRAREILRAHAPRHLSAKADAAIRRRFEILLPAGGCETGGDGSGGRHSVR